MKSFKTEYASRIVCLTFALIFLAGATGLATVWMRQSIGAAAAETRSMEIRLNEVDRALSRINSEIAVSLNPGFLQSQIERFNLDLRRPDDEQIVRLDAPRLPDRDYAAGDGSNSSSDRMAFRREGLITNR